MSQIYDKCCAIAKTVYNCLMFFSFRTKPELQNHASNSRDKSNTKYCEMYDLDDFTSETH